MPEAMQMIGHRHPSHCPQSAHQAKPFSCFDQRTVGLLDRVRSVWVRVRLCENRYERGQLLRAHPVVAAVLVVPLAKATAAKATAAVLVVVAASVATATPVSENWGQLHKP